MWLERFVIVVISRRGLMPSAWGVLRYGLGLCDVRRNHRSFRDAAVPVRARDAAISIAEMRELVAETSESTVMLHRSYYGVVRSPDNRTS